MHADRLLKLAELLEADAANPKGLKFDLHQWGGPADDVDFDESAEIGISCNTQACAMGLAVLSGEFAQYGLYNASNDPTICILPAMPRVNGITPTQFNAAADLFGIAHHVAKHFFDPDYYPEGETEGAEAELAVATRIREYVADETAGAS